MRRVWTDNLVIFSFFVFVHFTLYSQISGKSLVSSSRSLVGSLALPMTRSDFAWTSRSSNFAIRPLPTADDAGHIVRIYRYLQPGAGILGVRRQSFGVL